MSLDSLATLRAEAETSLASAVDLASLIEWERATFGPKGSLTLFLRSLGQAPAEERPALGRAANEVKLALTAVYDQKKAALEGAAFVCRSVSNDLAAELLDRRQQGLTQLGRRWRDDDAGSFHCRDLVFGTALAA